MFDLHVYHILVLVIVKHSGDEPPKNSVQVFRHYVYCTSKVLATAFPIGLERQGYIAVCTVFTRNAERPECINNGTLQVQHMEGLTAGDISAGMLSWYTI